MKHNIMNLIYGGVSLLKLRAWFSGAKFWRVRTPGRKADLEL